MGQEIEKVCTDPQDLSPTEQGLWRVGQALFWGLGVAILALLLFAPKLGIHAFWDVLIPVIPAFAVFAPGLWRNLCPMATTVLFPRHVGLGLHYRISNQGRDLLSLAGLAGLLLLIPLRHVLLNTDGPATAIVLVGLALIGVAMGLGFQWRSGWCSSLCPVHHVVKLYGTRPAVTLNNAQCNECERCVAICLDWTPSSRLAQVKRTRLQGMATTLMVGGFVGYIWGWFHVPDYRGAEGFAQLGTAFGLPFGGMAASLLLFLFLRWKLEATQQHRLVMCFTAAAVSCYYWYRLPALLGYGPFPGDGMLFDLRGVLPMSLVFLLRATTTALFFWWFMGRDGESRRRWSRRPPFAEPGEDEQLPARS